ncbi:tRNA pseudouridine(38-40) synthase TruA [Terrimonas sp.]|uniref:tRNA pseudouridine(38-40) synthase TruA n=1 Tax=Terrimonas sp. TaxID=1914338 RepID=UPI000D50A697|nr:tRNA pseudouridine(38-40) synthase TruA [Terrimonas sp.]PVD53321.1 tRNA pseudouridine(38-40) synthase TruA [Terrimonas sp.]
MPRYFIEVAYKGNNYAGFQVQDNVLTIQSEVQKALAVFYKEQIPLTGSSRTDAGVHALQNYFHADVPFFIQQKNIYNLNALLPRDIAIKNILQVNNEAHCRFDAESREYKYYVSRKKNPFITDRSYFFPYSIDEEKLHEAAATILNYTDFTSFSKRNTQVKTFICQVLESRWVKEDDCLVYHVKANRFLRGMVRGLTGTMLQVAREKITIDDFKKIIESRDCTKADFAVPGHGLFLVQVNYPERVWKR